MVPQVGTGGRGFPEWGIRCCDPRRTSTLRDDHAPDTTTDSEQTRMSTDYSRALGARLRAIRNQQGLSLQGVEDKSHGRWKAVVVGSYERGDRAVTVQRLSELAVFYGVPVSELLPDPRPSSAVTSTTKIVLNLESLGSLPADEAGPLARYASTIQAQRHDYNGKVLSIRAEDLKSLAIIYDMSPDELTTRLIEWGVLKPGGMEALGAGADDDDEAWTDRRRSPR